MFDTGLSKQQTLQQIQNKLKALQDALSNIVEMHAWSSGISTADLETLGFTASDAAALLTASNDANAIASIYSTGLPPTGYPQPSGAYPYAASQAEVIGPQ